MLQTFQYSAICIMKVNGLERSLGYLNALIVGIHKEILNTPWRTATAFSIRSMWMISHHFQHLNIFSNLQKMRNFLCCLIPYLSDQYSYYSHGIHYWGNILKSTIVRHKKRSTIKASERYEHFLFGRYTISSSWLEAGGLMGWPHSDFIYYNTLEQ